MLHWAAVQVARAASNAARGSNISLRFIVSSFLGSHDDTVRSDEMAGRARLGDERHYPSEALSSRVALVPFGYLPALLLSAAPVTAILRGVGRGFSVSKSGLERNFAGSLPATTLGALT
jgi:hypothetical protein